MQSAAESISGRDPTLIQCMANGWRRLSRLTKIFAMCGLVLCVSMVASAAVNGDTATIALTISPIIILLLSSGMAIADLSIRLVRSEWALNHVEGRRVLAERAKAVFLSNISHELRTPLNAIIGFSQIIREELLGPLGTPAYRDSAQAIEDAGNRLLSALNDILHITASCPIGSDFREDVIDPAELVAGLLIVTKPRADAARVALSCDISAHLPLLSGDGPHIKHVLFNLIDNAIKFTPPGGRILVRVVPAEDGGMAFTVEDTGIGIAPENLITATEDFTIGEDVFARSYQGQGLGLAIARRLMELHGGTLTLRNRSEKGTTATAAFPRDRVVDRTARSF